MKWVMGSPVNGVEEAVLVEPLVMRGQEEEKVILVEILFGAEVVEVLAELAMVLR